jgi:hypothetical protein
MIEFFICIFNDFNSVFNEFNFVYNVLESSISSFSKFINEHVNYIVVDNNKIVLEIVVLDPNIDDSIGIKKFYKHEVNSINDMLKRLRINLEVMKNLNELISSHQLNEVVSEDSCNKCVRDFNIS